MYLLDANAFMEAGRTYYGFSIAPGFWDWLAARGNAGDIASIGPVKDEITAGAGDLVDWATNLPASFWLPETDDVVRAMAALAAWAVEPARQYRQEAVTEFMASADLRLVAHGIATGATIVTREQPAPDSKKRIKIPDVCDAFDVTWTDPFSAYRSLGMCLVA